MSSSRIVILSLNRLEAAHLGGLVRQFVRLLDQPRADDHAIARLTPDAYPDDPDASAEFRRVTESDLLSARRSDAARVLADLGAEDADTIAEAHASDPVDLRLDPEDATAWLRTLAAIRLVLASRLGIRTEDDHDSDDPRFGIYDWLGYRLETLVQALGSGIRP
jgi:hypothetical protein